MSKHEYILWKNNPVQTRGSCVVVKTASIDPYLTPIALGKPLQSAWPVGACVAMNPESPDDTVLVDSLTNGMNILVGSQRLRALLEENDVAPIEYLPVDVLDHTGKVAARYHVINPLEPLDVLDTKAAGAVVIARQVIKVKQLALLPDERIANRLLFRLAGFPQGIVLRRDLADAMSKAGMTGMTL